MTQIMFDRSGRWPCFVYTGITLAQFQLLFRGKRAVEIKPKDNIVGLIPQKQALEKLKHNMRS